MKPSAYIETTIISYLTAWPSRDLVRAAQQQITREWWELERLKFDLYTSELVLIEAAAGDADAAAQRLAVLRDRIEEVCELAGLRPPAICTPDELLGDES